MGQKAHPLSSRLRNSLSWHSEWFSYKKEIGSKLTFVLYELKQLILSIFFRRGFFVHSFKTKYYNNTLYLTVCLLPSYSNWLAFQRTNLKSENLITLKKEFFSRINEYILKLFKFSKTPKFFQPSFKKVFKIFLKANWFLLKKNKLNYFDAEFFEKINKSFVTFQNLPNVIFCLKDLSKEVVLKVPKNNINLTDEWVYLFNLFKQTNPTALAIGLYLKHLLENKGLRKRQRFLLNNLRRFLIQNQNLLTNLSGLKIQVTGRLNGRNRSTNYVIHFGRLPLQTFSENVDYIYIPAFTLYGVFGIKVWLVF